MSPRKRNTAQPLRVRTYPWGSANHLERVDFGCPLRRGITLTEGPRPGNTKEALQRASTGYFRTDVAQITRARDRGRTNNSPRGASTAPASGIFGRALLCKARQPGVPGRLNRREFGGAQSAACGSPPCRAYRPQRSCGRVAEGGGLLNRYRVVKPYRGFESLRLRHPQPVRPGHIGNTTYLRHGS